MHVYWSKYLLLRALLEFAYRRAWAIQLCWKTFTKLQNIVVREGLTPGQLPPVFTMRAPERIVTQDLREENG